MAHIVFSMHSTGLDSLSWMSDFMAPWFLECPFELVYNRLPFWNQVRKYSASGFRATQS